VENVGVTDPNTQLLSSNLPGEVCDNIQRAKRMGVFQLTGGAAGFLNMFGNEINNRVLNGGDERNLRTKIDFKG
jgi:hypothetical protein